MSRQWNLQDGESVTSLVAAVPYTADCPACGGDAVWRDILVNISGVLLGSRSAVQPEIECPSCGPVVGVEFDG